MRFFEIIYKYIQIFATIKLKTYYTSVVEENVFGFLDD